MLEAVDPARRVARVDAAVQVQRGTGPGEELFARLIHAENSGKRKTPYLAINCGAFSHDQFGSEVFGHVEGARARRRTDATGPGPRLSERDGALSPHGEHPSAGRRGQRRDPCLGVEPCQDFGSVFGQHGHRSTHRDRDLRRGRVARERRRRPFEVKEQRHGLSEWRDGDQFAGSGAGPEEESVVVGGDGAHDVPDPRDLRDRLGGAA